MVAAGLDTMPGNINLTIAYLSSEHGQDNQKRLYKALLEAYQGEDIWARCVEEQKCELMISFVKVRRTYSFIS